MQALVYKGPKTIYVESKDIPEVKRGEALVRVFYAGICGSDMHIYHGVHPRAKAPLIMGHEFCGEVVDINDEDNNIKIGDMVVPEPLLFCGKCHACLTGNYHVCYNLGLLGIDRDGGFAEYAAVPVSKLHKIPKDMSKVDAAIIEPVAVAVHTVRMSRLKIGDDVVIMGAGPIGTLVAETCKTAGAKQIIMTDVKEDRIQKARERDFMVINSLKENLVEKIMDLTNGKGADIVFDVAGVEATAAIDTKLVRVRGQIVVVAVFNDPPRVNYRDVSFKEIDIVGVRVYNFEDYDMAINLVYNKKINVSNIVTHIFNLDEGEKGFKVMESGNGMKVLFKLND